MAAVGLAAAAGTLGTQATPAGGHSNFQFQFCGATRRLPAKMTPEEYIVFLKEHVRITSSDPNLPGSPAVLFSAEVGIPGKSAKVVYVQVTTLDISKTVRERLQKVCAPSPPSAYLAHSIWPQNDERRVLQAWDSPEAAMLAVNEKISDLAERLGQPHLKPSSVDLDGAMCDMASEDPSEPERRVRPRTAPGPQFNGSPVSLGNGIVAIKMSPKGPSWRTLCTVRPGYERCHRWVFAFLLAHPPTHPPPIQSHPITPTHGPTLPLNHTQLESGSHPISDTL